jgi:uncharacterized protein (TIGR02117 family)
MAGKSLTALVCVLVAFAALIGCSATPAKKTIPLTQLEHRIFFVYRDWHTSVVISTQAYLRNSALAPHSKLLPAALADFNYIRIGWGDGTYFTGKSKTLGAATKALFASDFSALQLIGYKDQTLVGVPPATFTSLLITDKGMRNLVAYIDQSFLLDEQAELIPLPAYVENAGVFFKSIQRYGLLSNCNTWSGRALQAAQIPIRSRLHLTAKSVFEQAQQVSKLQIAAGAELVGE